VTAEEAEHAEFLVRVVRPQAIILILVPALYHLILQDAQRLTE